METKLMYLALLLVPAQAWAHNWGSNEGELLNATGQAAVCFWDEQEHVCMAPVARNEVCKGDAMGPAGLPWVYKVPNRTAFFCGKATCLPADTYSQLRLLAAMAHNGAANYGRMSMLEFYRVMGRRPILPCNERLPSF